ncbi:hypothetical protein HMPREF3086_07820 [Dietzia sp. HMSC21D01]|uniref:Urease accessory protein n=1 Tax=Dietzia cinnamea TaxID=321318 RepID=A0AAW5QAS5_9ACTN|nr:MULTISPECIES: hypothetical protein [Dietzia]MCT1862916.1 hypothetical protein [Dietzia cinnamea]MCT2030698.1 hypothetical protein [Dietzia cinnamea]MCT2033705.1 hypothetical protein [Dietzia cinnamea]MCT2075395.1 hypothetical protein [Dietzia cinnamea]MCT2106794.1 hypothetical protein [Dietzia cinnamea]
MTAHPIVSNPVTTGARRLLDGSGIATVAVRGTKNRSDVMVSAGHRWIGEGTIVVTGTPAPWSGLMIAPGDSVEVVVMIDEFAPIVEAKVHVASLYGFGVARAARQGEGWIVEIEIELGEVNVRRLGHEGTVDAAHLDAVPSDPLACETPGLADEIRARFGSDLAMLAGSGDPAQPPYVLGVDADGLHLLTALGTDADVIHLPFVTRAECVNDVVREMGQYVARAS